MTFIGGGKLGLPDNAVVAFALGRGDLQVGLDGQLEVRRDARELLRHRRSEFRGTERLFCMGDAEDAKDGKKEDEQIVHAC